MRLNVCAAAFILVLSHSQFLASQNTPVQSADAQAAAAIVKNANAVAILHKMLNANGWNLDALPADVMATGAIALESADGGAVGQDVVFTVQGKVKSRIELGGASGSVTVCNGKSGSSGTADKSISIPAHVAQSQRPTYFPFLIDVLDFRDKDNSVEEADQVDLNGTAAYKIKLASHRSGDDALTEDFRKASETTLWISTDSFSLLQIEFTQLAINNRFSILRLTKKYSDYRAVQGIAVPFHQEEWVDTQKSSTLDLKSVSFNQGVSPDKFVVAKSEKAVR